MEKLLLQVLAVVLNIGPAGNVEETTVRLDRLPPECSAVYDTAVRKFTRAQTTEIITVDMDGDGQKEMLVYNGLNASSGEGWTVMRKREGRWSACGEIFGVIRFLPHSGRTGLLVESPCGWSYADWSYYELGKGGLREMFSIGVEYRQPIRRHPVRITVTEAGK